MRLAMVIEQAENSFSAYAPDRPGGVATGQTIAAVEAGMREAIAFHLDGLREDGRPLPQPSSRLETIAAAASVTPDRHGCTRHGRPRPWPSLPGRDRFRIPLPPDAGYARWLWVRREPLEIA